jgi:hypothetical protein
MPTQAGVPERKRELSCPEHCADILMVTVYVLTFINKQLLVFLFVVLEKEHVWLTHKTRYEICGMVLFCLGKLSRASNIERRII